MNYRIGDLVKHPLRVYERIIFNIVVTEIEANVEKPERVNDIRYAVMHLTGQVQVDITLLDGMLNAIRVINALTRINITDFIAVLLVNPNCITTVTRQVTDLV
jgi:hypothetical protein